MGFRVTGIDISKEVIKQVNKLSEQKGYDIPFYEYGGHVLPFEAESFDAVVIWAQTFGLMYGNEYKHEILLECKRVLKDYGLVSFSGHDYNYEIVNYINCMKGRKFYPYLNTDMYWETFEPSELISFGKNARYDIILCEKGEIYKPEDGIVLHCLCKNQKVMSFDRLEGVHEYMWLSEGQLLRH